jgi:hypothetical protein
VWREDAGGDQPQRLVLLDTPDIDGTLRDNWRRAELIRNACDVIVAVLTQQKYNDATVRDFFSAAAAAGKTMIVVFNMVDWPAQRQVLAGWLRTFMLETGAEPAAVYAAPFDRDSAAAGRIEFQPLAELTPDGTAVDLRQRLTACDFERIKIASMEGAFRVVVDPAGGASAWLKAFEAAAGEWQEARRVLSDESRVRVEMPTAPREIVWNEIWKWLEPRRSGFDLTVSRVYHVAGRGVKWAARRVGLARTEEERREDFAALELATSSTGSTRSVARTRGWRRRWATDSSRLTGAPGMPTSSGGMPRCRSSRTTTAPSPATSSMPSPTTTPTWCGGSSPA